jgi:predicted transcriptional regulator
MAKKKWAFLSNHGRILTYIANHSQVTKQSLAYKTGLSIRAVHLAISDLEEEGYLNRKKIGRNNKYEVNPDKPLRHRLEKNYKVSDLLAVFGHDNRNMIP